MTETMSIALKETRLGLRNSTTRLPFRYGNACLTSCPQAILQATIELNGKPQRGFSGDCLPPGWFDKTPGKSFSQQIDEMLAVISTAEDIFADVLSAPSKLFPAWRVANDRIHDRVRERGLPGLLASFGVSMVERAIMDAMARAAGLGFHAAVRRNIFAIDPGEVYADLAGTSPSTWIPETPTESIHVRHTIGLSDPLTNRDLAQSERLNDGFPETLEDYLKVSGLRYLKIKVSNQLDIDLERLKTIAELAQRYRGNDYFVTLDGNEQYKEASQFDELIEAIRSLPELQTLLANTLVIEQPLDRRIALDPDHTAGVKRLSRSIPVIIDESDQDVKAYETAIDLGYRGISSKNCKGPIRSLLNAGLTWLRNERGKVANYVMTGEDLCTVGIVPVQSDLCLVATLGLKHVERNGHHYHRGLSYLPEEQQRAALVAHPDLYARRGGIIAPHVVEGRFQIASLSCPGFGFNVEPDMSCMCSPAEWNYDSLGIE